MNYEFHGELKEGQSWYGTEITALQPITGELRRYGGPHVPGISVEDAQEYCNRNIGYCKVIGQLIAEIGTKADGITPDFDDQTNYDLTQQQ